MLDAFEELVGVVFYAESVKLCDEFVFVYSGGFLRVCVGDVVGDFTCVPTDFEGGAGVAGEESPDDDDFDALSVG